ncbi:6612_t:CDS:2 [Acaulospora colombiana]|uniref:6612_t:CDS:1 n=1 Tax=Acaulospora colombiana TaxID=27376 RepID=A0ACA9MCF9_9GLOM|nr:6612_t:CDS:2 [Acaulospora colombiana]
MADSQENTYTLFCVLKDNPHSSFSVKPPPSATVDDVKVAIMPGATPRTRITVTLYSTKLPDDSSLAENVRIAISKNPQPLRSSTKLYQIYSSPPPEETVHIIVELPSGRQLVKVVAFYWWLTDLFLFLYQRHATPLARPVSQPTLKIMPVSPVRH